MGADDKLALALSEWQRKYRVSDEDPMVAVLDLVRLAMQHPPRPEAATTPMPPTFEEFRATMELLDSRSKVFVTQSTTLIGELRTFARTVERLNDRRAAAMAILFLFALGSGVGIGWCLWK